MKQSKFKRLKLTKSKLKNKQTIYIVNNEKNQMEKIKAEKIKL